MTHHISSRYKDALSLLRAVREVFENSTIPEITELFNATDMGILHKLFSWNLVFGRAKSSAYDCEYFNHILQISDLFNATDMGIIQKLFSWNLVFWRARSGVSSCEYSNDPKFWDR